jgi:hypothetical protein
MYKTFWQKHTLVLPQKCKMTIRKEIPDKHSGSEEATLTDAPKRIAKQISINRENSHKLSNR